MYPMVLGIAVLITSAELESRQLTHYVPQDLLDKAVRTEGWTEVPLAVKGGTRKDDVVRIWSGGLIDRGGADQPGVNVGGPNGPGASKLAFDASKLVLSPKSDDAFAVLVKAEGPGIKKCLPPGKPLEIKLTKDKERLFIGFNDEKGRYTDNHIGKGKRHELDPLWLRVEVVRITVD